MRYFGIFSTVFALMALSACSGAGGGGIAHVVTMPSEAVPIQFELVNGDAYDEFSSRIWDIDNNTLSINADITGDGRLDKLDFVIEYLLDQDEPELTVVEDHYIIGWPRHELYEVEIGDVDQDGDADIILDEGEGRYVLLNVGSYEPREPLDPKDFVEMLEKINDLVMKGEVSAAFDMAFEMALGTPHDWTPPGEGKEGRYDRDEEIDLDKGNCVTWVEQIIAMVNSGGSAKGFIDSLMGIRYRDGVKEYPMRNHFQSVDWIPNNISNGYIDNLLPDMFDDDFYFVKGVIDRRNWYAAKTGLEGDFSDLNDDEMDVRLEELNMLGSFMRSEDISLFYYPFDKMVVNEGDKFVLDPQFVQSLPEISIFNVVNDDLKIEDEDGEWITDLIVSHVGFLVKDKEDNIIVYHSTNKTDAALSEMAQEDLISFLAHRYLKNDETTAVGLHLSKPLIKAGAITHIKVLITPIKD